MFRRIKALILKEFLAIFLDKSSRMSIIVPPIMQLLIFGYAATFDLTGARGVLFNEEKGAVIREVMREIRNNAALERQGCVQ